MRYMRYKTIQLPKTVGEKIRRLIDERRELGYVSLKGFLEDAIRSRLDVITGGRLAGTEA